MVAITKTNHSLFCGNKKKKILLLKNIIYDINNKWLESDIYVAKKKKNEAYKLIKL